RIDGSSRRARSAATSISVSTGMWPARGSLRGLPRCGAGVRAVVRFVSRRFGALDGAAQRLHAMVGLEGEPDEPAELADRIGMIVDLETHDAVVVQTDAAVLLDDDQRSGLHAAHVASGGLTRVQRGDETLREVPAGLLESVDHLVHDVLG